MRDISDWGKRCLVVLMVLTGVRVCCFEDAVICSLMVLSKVLRGGVDNHVVNYDVLGARGEWLKVDYLILKTVYWEGRK